VRQPKGVTLCRERKPPSLTSAVDFTFGTATVAVLVASVTTTVSVSGISRLARRRLPLGFPSSGERVCA
jgi:hypothetical protein